MRSPAVRGVFLALAVAAAVWAVAANWADVSRVARTLPVWSLGLALAASFAYVAATMLSWRAIIADASPVDPRVAGRIFYSSQVAKYLPGGVWNFVAAAEVGRDHSISRIRSVASLLIAVAISIVTGLALAGIALLAGPGRLRHDYGWIAPAIPLGLVVLAPPVLDRIANAGLRLVRREGSEVSTSWGAAVRAAAWAAAAWALMGAQLWLMLTALGMEASPASFLRATGGYALGWTAGFLVFFAPAGAGVREVALGAALAGTVEPGALVLVVLVSRVLTTVADITLGVAASFAMRRGRDE